MRLGIAVTVVIIGMACLGAIPRSKYADFYFCHALALDPLGCYIRKVIGS